MRGIRIKIKSEDYGIIIQTLSEIHLNDPNKRKAEAIGRLNWQIVSKTEAQKKGG